jgi:broad specificity phosphatase PhoE
VRANGGGSWAGGWLFEPATDHRSGISPNPEGEAYLMLPTPSIAHAIVGAVLTVLLTRHGHTDRSEPEQYLGQRIDVSLSERGRQAAGRLAERLNNVHLDRIISSPLARAAETARIIAGPRAVELDARLAELDYGAWEGLTLEQIEQRFPGEFELYEADPADHHVGGGEDGRQVARRLAALIGELLDSAAAAHSEQTCLLVGHSSTNRILLAQCLGVALRDYRRRFEQDWANLTVLRWPDRQSGPLLLLANDLAHVRGLTGVTWG